jgi:DNA-binding FadR family transcriptional regulator
MDTWDDWLFGGILTLRTAHRASLVDQVIDQFKGEIASGAWTVGNKIPSEPALSESLGVGRNTIREAVKALTHAGLLECRQGDGTYVRATSEMSGAVRRRLRTAKLIEILEVRRALEVEAARLAATYRDAADIAAIDAACLRREAAMATSDYHAFVGADLDFHTAIVEATHNHVLIELWHDFTETVRSTIASVSADMSHNADIPHTPIADAVRRGDAEAAALASHACMAELFRIVKAAPR